MFFSIPQCYDSHLHLLATGMVREGLSLKDLRSVDDLKNLKIQKHHFQGDWLMGFGWDEYNWSKKELPTRQDLDKYFADFPVCFSRVDGHALWVNTKALQLTGIVHDFSSGILIDSNMQKIEQFIPKQSLQNKSHFLKSAMGELNKRGFTHARDMSGDKEQWNLLTELDQRSELTLYIEENFYCDKIENLDQILNLSLYARKNETTHLRASGVKIYFDGALGSEGALLSQNYCGHDSSGFAIWSELDLKEVIQRTWENNLQVSIHAIGDEAVHRVAQVALQVWKSGQQGQLNIEHGELMRPESIEILSLMNTCVHMQPCHWLSDQRWLEKKLGSLYKFAFPWEKLQAAGVGLQWGSDTPIEAASVFSNMHALQQSAQVGIPAFLGNPLLPHSHPNKNWGGKCESSFAQTNEEERVLKVIFDGKEIIN